MRFVVILIVMSSAASFADDEPLRALVVDDNNERVPTHTVAPTYPEKARRDRIEGEVQVCFDVDRKGRPHRIAVRRSTHRAFERPSIRAVRASRFKALQEGESTAIMKTCRTFTFELVPD